MVLFVAPDPCGAQVSLVQQQPTVGGGTRRNSCLWVDPSGQNDLDSDAIAWEDFQLIQQASVVQLSWWGDALPPLGFRIRFYNQDPGTIAVQPDIFRVGAQPIASFVIAAPVVESAGGSLWKFSAPLPQPVVFGADTRYFVSVVALTPVPFAGWGWAQSPTGTNGTFWWQRGAHMYFHTRDNRAVELFEAGVSCDSIDFNNDTSVFDPADIDAFLSVYGEGPCVPDSASCNDIDFNNDGSLYDPCDIDAFLQVFSEGPCTECGV